MECIICSDEMSYFFSKEFNKFNLTTVDYWKCNGCGFCLSKTHYDLSEEEWQKLNYDFHTSHNLRNDNPFNRRQRIYHQAEMINIMERLDFFKGNSYLDWGSGEGDLSEILNSLFNIRISNFDMYVTPKSFKVDKKNLKKRSYDLVINTGVFEHVTSRSTLNLIEQCVSEIGCLAIHTLIPERIPNDPNWMYLLPVHCSFHTNKSMQILMDQWGYKYSVYNKDAKMWILFKDGSGLTQKSEKLNNLLGWNYLEASEGFMDYWK